MSKDYNSFDNLQLIEFLKSLDKRITRIENKLNINPDHAEIELQNSIITTDEEYREKDYLESNFGESWFVNIGVLALAISLIIFLVQPFKFMNPFLPGAIGLIISASIAAFGNRMKKSNEHFSKYLIGIAMAFSYFSVLRFSYFTPIPAIQNRLPEAVLLLLLSGANFLITLPKKSQFLTGISITMILVSALMTGNSYFIFAVILLASILFVHFSVQYKWRNFIYYGIIAAYSTHFIWAINNPLIGNNLMIIAEPKINLPFILLYALVFTLLNYFYSKDEPKKSLSKYSLIFNGFVSFGLYQGLCIIKLREQILFYDLIFFFVFFFISLCCWVKLKGNLTASIYSLLAYVALSVSIISAVGMPNQFVYLIWQSLIVIATAIWFKSKFIIIANFFMFILILAAFLLTTNSYSVISVSFGIVALISARLLNFQKKRLVIKTELMRNSYLAIALIIIPFALLKSISVNFVGLSWLFVAIIYYVMSIILKNFKYRLMGHLTIISTLIYFFTYGLANSDTEYKIITLFAVGICTVAVSILFTKFAKKPIKSENAANN